MDMDLKIDRHLASDTGRVVMLVVLFASMAVFLGRPGVREYLLDIQGMREILQGGHGGSGRILSAFLFILLWAGLISAGVPRLWAS
ncbi:MAG TPA: hypothetical protein VN416_08155, partial [Desulfomonilia bacterium]|nr:hypothetical protein [Desulfomonilia bacterium]